jgi:hypothetical protein
MEAHFEGERWRRCEDADSRQSADGSTVTFYLGSR